VVLGSLAFEPQRQLFQALGGSLAINGYDHVYLHNCGLGAEPSTAQLPAVDYSMAQDFGTVALSDETTVDEHGWMNDRVVDVTSIDAMDLPRLDFFKLDVEGYEVPALTGAIETIKKHQPWIWVEYFITGSEPIKQALCSIPDYDYYIVDYQNMLCVPQSRANLVNVSGLQKV
jgi:FkbM family methyltransferase